MKITSLIAFSLLATAFTSHANKNLDTEMMLKALGENGDIKHFEKLPIGELNFVETDSGLTYIVSSNGRFVIQGKLVDVWKNKVISNAQDASDLKYLQLSQMGIVDAEMGIMKIGNPTIPKQGYLLLDPQSKYTKIIIDKIIADQKSYHLDIMLIPQLKGSEEIIQRLWCAKDKNSALMDLIYRTTTAIQQEEDCDIRPVVRNRALFSLLDKPKTPLTIRIDGFRLSGVPLDLKAFLDNSKEKIKARLKHKKDADKTLESQLPESMNDIDMSHKIFSQNEYEQAKELNYNIEDQEITIDEKL